MTTRRVVVLTIVALVVMCATAFAHDGVYTWTFTGIGSGAQYTVTHNDESPYKGTMSFTFENGGDVAWGDFHFKISGENIQNVTISDTDPNKPTSSQSGFSYVIDNSAPGGATIDYYFYDSPVATGNSATFSFYTDNPDKGIFGVCMYPTPVPEPSSLLAMGSGAVGLLGLALRRRK